MLNVTPNLRTQKYLLLTFGTCHSEHISIGKYINRNRQIAGFNQL